MDNRGTETASPQYGCGHASPDWISWGKSCHRNGKYDPAQTQTTRATGAWLPLPLTPCHAPRREEFSQHHALVSKHCFMYHHHSSSYKMWRTSIWTLGKCWVMVNLCITKQQTIHFSQMNMNANFLVVLALILEYAFVQAQGHVHECKHLCCRHHHKNSI